MLCLFVVQMQSDENMQVHFGARPNSRKEQTAYSNPLRQYIATLEALLISNTRTYYATDILTHQLGSKGILFETLSQVHRRLEHSHPQFTHLLVCSQTVWQQ